MFIFDLCGFGSQADDFFKKAKEQKHLQILGYQSFEEYILGAFVEDIKVPEDILNIEKWYEQKLIEYTRTVSMDTYKKNSNYRCLSKCATSKCIKRNNGECSQKNTARLIHEASAYKQYIE